jgi:phenylalanyl-tRNA synthetase beta chain
MRISFKWLQQYIELKETPENVAETLTGVGLEVESIEYLGKKFDGFFVAEVADVQKHPNADRLSVCSVIVTPEKEPLQIVCGAPNVAKGQKVIAGIPGAVIPKNQHAADGTPLTLAKTKIRGIESNGMICSEFELGLGDDKSGIKVLPADAPVGSPLAEFLGQNDIAFEIGITPNRPDCLCHIGIARDLSAVFGRNVKYPDVKIRQSAGPSINDLAVVKVENALACPRYSARMIKNVIVQDSPEWLKNILIAAGQRPINNIVDVTNYVMLEYGQPLHAFDYDRLAKHTIVVKNSQPGDRFTTLDGRSHELSGAELMICDAERPVAIAGVMGGLNSEISSATTTVLLECAYFDPVSTRRTAKKLGLSTDASYRFERGTDPNIVDIASKRAAALIADFTGGEVVAGAIDEYPKPIQQREIQIRLSRVNDILGTEISDKESIRLLESIGVTIKSSSPNSFICSVPTYRPDIEQEIDLIEEIARLYGYDNIPNAASGDVVFSEPSVIDSVNNQIAQWLQANGFNEVVTNSLIEEHVASAVTNDIVKVKNPLSAELEVMRPSLLPSLLQTVAYNFNHGAGQIRFFEFGNIFLSSEKQTGKTTVKGIKESRSLGLVISGIAQSQSWHGKQREFDIFDLKGMVQSMLLSIGLDNIHLIYYDASSSLTEQTIGIEINGTYAGSIGRCLEKYLKRLKIEKNVFYAEIDLDVIANNRKQKTFKPYSKFPTVIRDIAFIVNADVRAAAMMETIRKAGGQLVTNVELFDVFEGKSIGEGKKSVAFSVFVNSFEKTLTDKEIDEVISRIVNEMSTTHGSALRSI